MAKPLLEAVDQFNNAIVQLVEARAVLLQSLKTRKEDWHGSDTNDGDYDRMCCMSDLEVLLGDPAWKEGDDENEEPYTFDDMIYHLDRACFKAFKAASAEAKRWKRLQADGTVE